MDPIVYGGFAVVLTAAVAGHLRQHRKREAAAVAAAEKAGLGKGDGPRAQHPAINVDHCIGCGACVTACPEGDVLAVIGGKAALVHGSRCIGHGLCAEACPVGAIEIVMASPSMTADLPALSPDLEASVPNFFIAGELGGLALIKNAVNQGRDCIDRIAARVPVLRRGPDGDPPPLDVVIIGAGPAGLSGSLRARELGLRFVTLEAEGFGGTVAKYPRQKLVMTSPVEFPLYGKLNQREITKEKLLELWSSAAKKGGLDVRTQERVEAVVRDSAGRFTVRTTKGEYHALAVLMAIGRRGTPNKLGVPGEELPHVMYSLLDAEAYAGKRILVVGGGDSAVEAAMGLASQKGNRVTVSYRQAEFKRLKHRNQVRIQEMITRKELTVLFNSKPTQIGVKSATVDVGGQPKEVAADFVWIFAGGTLPKTFLEGMGIAFGRQDLSGAVATEAATRGEAVAV